MISFEKYKPLLEQAIDAVENRHYFSPFIESPSAKFHEDGAKESGLQNYEGRLNQPFQLEQLGQIGVASEEVSPYTREALGVRYPICDVNVLVDAAQRSFYRWNEYTINARVSVCMEILARLSRQLFENAYATMHTTGQAFMMAFAGSGANSLDRGLEAIAFACKALNDVPKDATYRRDFGRHKDVTLSKYYRVRGRGVAAVITCGSYPAWNAYPAIFANLATGNPVVLKPHPRAVLPMAIFVETARSVLEEFGFDPNVVSLLVDTAERPITKQLAQHRKISIVDFTGSQTFGAWLEEQVRVPLYTETAGCNAVILESTNDINETVDAIAQGISLFSSQMCTAPQNIFIPRSGIATPDGSVSVHAFEKLLTEAIDDLVSEHGAAVCGAIFDEGTIARIETAKFGTHVIRDSSSYEHPEFPSARTATPLLVRATPEELAFRGEWFGPIAFVIECDDREHAAMLAGSDAMNHGSIASYCYSTDRDFRRVVEDIFWRAGANIGFNLHKQRPINFTAAFSDYHVTGLNPAGNACLTDLAFVANRFRIVQGKTELP